jgi:hypothetical protein
MGVGSGENVLVSCIIIATTNFCATIPSAAAKSLSNLSNCLKSRLFELCTDCKPASRESCALQKGNT